MLRLSFAILLLASGTVCAGTIYKWVDAQGTIHYSDQPRPGASELQIESAPRMSPPAPVVASATTASGATADGEPFRYDSCAISRPAADETLQNAFSVSVAWQISPALRSGDRVTLALDGKLLAGVSPTGTSFTIAPVDRGTHTLMVSILDADGRGVCQSSAVTFHVRQPSLLSPPRRAPTPAPAPRPNTPRS